MYVFPSFTQSPQSSWTFNLCLLSLRSRMYQRFVENPVSLSVYEKGLDSVVEGRVLLGESVGFEGSSCGPSFSGTGLYGLLKILVSKLRGEDDTKRGRVAAEWHSDYSSSGESKDHEP